MVLTPPSSASARPRSADSPATVLATYHWLLLLGFPVDVAAARAMPELFNDAAPVPFVTDGVRVFLRAAA